MPSDCPAPENNGFAEEESAPEPAPPTPWAGSKLCVSTEDVNVRQRRRGGCSDGLPWGQGAGCVPGCTLHSALTGSQPWPSHEPTKPCLSSAAGGHWRLGCEATGATGTSPKPTASCATLWRAAVTSPVQGARTTYVLPPAGPGCHSVQGALPCSWGEDTVGPRTFLLTDGSQRQLSCYSVSHLQDANQNPKLNLASQLLAPSSQAFRQPIGCQRREAPCPQILAVASRASGEKEGAVYSGRGSSAIRPWLEASPSSSCPSALGT